MSIHFLLFGFITIIFFDDTGFITIISVYIYIYMFFFFNIFLFTVMMIQFLNEDSYSQYQLF